MQHQDTVRRNGPETIDMRNAANHKAHQARIQVRMMQTEADVDATWPLMLAMHNESRFAAYRPNKSYWIEYLREHGLGDPNRYGMILAEVRGEPVGFLGCAVSRMLYCEERMASNLVFYVTRECRKSLLGGRVALKLLEAYRRWAQNRRAVELHVHVTAGMEIARADKFLQRAGFRQIGGNYLAMLPVDGAS